jgi:hypothetical protein
MLTSAATVAFLIPAVLSFARTLPAGEAHNFKSNSIR